MKYVQTSIASMLLSAAVSAPAQIGAPIPTTIEHWRPVSTGTWKITSVLSDSALRHPSVSTTSLVCPYSALLFLNHSANFKIGKAGCRHSVYKLSEQNYHIATQCRELRGGNHFETTSLRVSDGGQKFYAVTTWSGPQGSSTLQREGEFLSACAAN